MSEPVWSNVCNRSDTCALTGAAAFIAGIPNAEVLVNGPMWCYFYALRHLERMETDIARRMHGSQPNNEAIIYGSESFLAEALERLKARETQPELLLIETSCSLSLIGDDILGIAKKAALPHLVSVMDCGGIIGGFAEGYRKAALTILNDLSLVPQPVMPNRVNLIGGTPFYCAGKEDIKEIVRLLELCGYEVNVCLGSGSPLGKIKELTGAALNIVLHAELGGEIAVYLEKEFGMPYVCAGLPYGLEGTKQWLQTIAAILPSDTTAVEEEIKRRDKKIQGLRSDVQMTWGNMWFDKAVVAAPGTVAAGIGDALRREWADMGKLTVISYHDVTSFGLQSTMADTFLIAGEAGRQIESIWETLDEGLLLGSSSERSLIRRDKHVVCCNIALPVQDELMLIEQPFCGLRGSEYMLQRLWNGYIQQRMKQG